MKPPFRRKGDRIEVRLGEEEREVLSTLPGLIASAGDAGGRFDYRAHPEDPAAEESYREVIGTALQSARIADRSVFSSAVAADSLSGDEAEAWLRVMGEARIALAAALGIEEDGWEEEADPASSPEMALLGYLGYLQESLIAEMVA